MLIHAIGQLTMGRGQDISTGIPLLELLEWYMSRGNRPTIAQARKWLLGVVAQYKEYIELYHLTDERNPKFSKVSSLLGEYGVRTKTNPLGVRLTFNPLWLSIYPITVPECNVPSDKSLAELLQPKRYYTLTCSADIQIPPLAGSQDSIVAFQRFKAQVRPDYTLATAVFSTEFSRVDVRERGKISDGLNRVFREVSSDGIGVSWLRTPESQNTLAMRMVWSIPSSAPGYQYRRDTRSGNMMTYPHCIIEELAPNIAATLTRNREVPNLLEFADRCRYRTAAEVAEFYRSHILPV